jgi:hypothetical protein
MLYSHVVPGDALITELNRAAADRGYAIDFGVVRIHQAKFAFEFRVADVAENGAPDGALARACPDQSDRAGPKQIFQAIG